jgi:hypothetical protein
MFVYWFMIIVRIDPGNVFRIHVSVAKYTANVDYGSVEMDDQHMMFGLILPATVLCPNLLMIWLERSSSGQ